ncbi:unnamed protein product [Leuciscus chuanchicus]
MESRNPEQPSFVPWKTCIQTLYCDLCSGVHISAVGLSLPSRSSLRFCQGLVKGLQALLCASSFPSIQPSGNSLSLLLTKSPESSAELPVAGLRMAAKRVRAAFRVYGLQSNGTHITSHKANGLPGSGVGQVLAKRGTPSTMAALQKPLTSPELFKEMEPLSLIRSLAELGPNSTYDRITETLSSSCLVTDHVDSILVRGSAAAPLKIWMWSGQSSPRQPGGNPHQLKLAGAPGIAQLREVTLAASSLPFLLPSNLQPPPKRQPWPTSCHSCEVAGWGFSLGADNSVAAGSTYLPREPHGTLPHPFVARSKLGRLNGVALRTARVDDRCQWLVRVLMRCSVVSVDPVLQSAATSGYWVSDGIFCFLLAHSFQIVWNMEAGGHEPLYALYTAAQCLASGYWNHFNKTTGTGEHTRAAPGTATSHLSAHPNRHSHHVTA